MQFGAKTDWTLRNKAPIIVTIKLEEVKHIKNAILFTRIY